MLKRTDKEDELILLFYHINAYKGRIKAYFMKVFVYPEKVYEGVLAMAHSDATIQTRVYIPNRGLLGYRESDHIDFFDESSEAIIEGEKMVGFMKNFDKKVKEVELPDNVVEEVVSAGSAYSACRRIFNNSAKKLVDLLSKE